MKWKTWAQPQTMLCIVHGSRHGALAKKVVAHARETRTKPPHPRQKAKATKKPRHHLVMSLQLRDPILNRLLPRGPRLGFRHRRTDSMAPTRTKPALLQLLLVAHCSCEPAQ